MTDIRRKFLDYFESNDHLVMPSSSLIPTDDSTLLFANAGMNQFKDIFVGKEKPCAPRTTTVQKCMRAGGKHNDLENVGYTKRHHTFFEMLGNFSFGDYFKEKAIEFAWTFVTKELGLSTDRLYTTVFHNDDEAHSLWTKRIGLDPKKVFRFGEKDNFWAMGDTGPCGPCSEIFVDLHPDGTLPSQQQFEQQSDRFLEIWNLVFMEFMQNADGTRERLPQPSIDTGMGLERTTAVISGVDNNYDTILFKNIFAEISKHSIEDYSTTHNKEIKTSQRVVADHIRAITFLIADGATPSKDGRGYVLRRIMRRAMRHGKKIGFKENVLSNLSKIVVKDYGSAYPELSKHSDQIYKVIEAEEEKFLETVDRGLGILSHEIYNLQKGKQTILKGDVAFQLYDTYGFPADLTADVLRENSMTLDQSGFDEAFERHREKARGTWKGSKGKEIENLVSKWAAKGIETRFLGYEYLTANGRILKLIQNGAEVPHASEGEEVEVLADQTPFYGESGGQVGDIGMISGQGFALEVIDTVKPTQKIHIHRCRVVEGRVTPNAEANFIVDAKARQDTARNHTATHMLHATLREILGTHVQQKGSLVTPERLRFDFTNPGPVTHDQISKIETIMNERIWKNSAMKSEVMPIQKAMDAGATALFDEKYGNDVRVLTIDEYSKELCGGTHLERTGDIGMFKVTKESSVSAGIRRIEALTHQRAFRFIQDLQNQVTDLSEVLGVSPEKVTERVEKILQTQKDLKKGKINQSTSVDVKEDSVQKIGNIQVLEQIVEIENPKDLRDLADRCMEKIKDGIVILGAKTIDKVFLVVKVSKAHTDKVKAGDLVKEAASIVGGSGGGRDDFAQAGGSQVDQLSQAIDKIKSMIQAAR